MKPSDKGAPGELALTKCAAQNCKKKDDRFGFCPEHYDHFKFGLIKKSGQPALDYEKKYDQFLAMKQRQGAKRAA